MKVAIGRQAILLVSGLLVFGGIFGLWQIALGVSVTNGCYALPYGMAFLSSGYSGGCPADTLPTYYAGDISVTLVIFGFLAGALLRFKKGKVSIGE